MVKPNLTPKAGKTDIDAYVSGSKTEGKTTKNQKIAKSKDPNYKKLTVYLPTELIDSLKIYTVKNTGKDLSETTEDVMRKGLEELDD